MNRVQLDTNALIALSDPMVLMFATIVERLEKGYRMEASVIAWHEYVRGPLLAEDRNRTLRVLEGAILPLTRETAELAANLFNLTGRRRASTADCLLAASAIETGAEFLTENRADFERFVPHGLRLV